MNVGELCIRTVVIAEPEERVFEAARRMRALHVGTLVVVEETQAGRRPVGVVTDRDLLFALTTGEPGHTEALRLATVMSREPATVRESEDVHAALDRMRERGVRRLPVVDERGLLVGILAYDDLIEWVAEQLTDLGTVVTREQQREQRLRP